MNSIRKSTDLYVNKFLTIYFTRTCGIWRDDVLRVKRKNVLKAASRIGADTWVRYGVRIVG